jgi:Mrp family chromosome partitioning ATPase
LKKRRPRGVKSRPAIDLTTGVRSDGGLAIVEFGGQLIHTAPAGVTSSLRYLLTRLQLNDPDEIPRRLAITSALHGEGVSYIVRSLAAVMAHDLERMVCVVDMNWWSGARTDPTSLGLADVVLRGHAAEEVLVETVTENLWFMPAGTVELAGRPAVAKDPRLAAALDDLERQFDHLIFDLPAVLATSDAIALARFADVYALVVRYGVTTVAQVKSALDELAGMASIGLIVNRSDSSIPRVVRRLVGI